MPHGIDRMAALGETELADPGSLGPNRYSKETTPRSRFRLMAAARRLVHSKMQATGTITISQARRTRNGSIVRPPYL